MKGRVLMIIYKYPLSLGINKISIPKPYIILSIKTQNNIPVMYAQIDNPKNELDNISIVGLMTGHTYDYSYLEFIDTVLLDNDTFVLHFFKKV